MSYDDILGTFNIDHIDGDLGPYLLLRAHVQRGDLHLVRRDLGRAVPATVLPDRARLIRSIDSGSCFDLLVDVDDVVVLLRTWKSAAAVWVTAASTESAMAVVEQILGRIPVPTDEGSVEVRFTDQETGTRHLPVDVRPWQDVSRLYPLEVQAAMGALLGHLPTHAEARRLLLWHGEPGTGKTSAVRALLHGWRDWADGVIVGDPEALLNNGRYLRRTLLDQDDDRWQLIVLEDAESVLRKASGGKAMSQLLNLADGLLGQGLRCLFLITTNERLTDIHPALTRPGRCLAQVEFGKLSPAQAAAQLGRPIDRAMTLAEVMAARPVTVKTEPVAVGQYL